ncbi:MAG: class I SAM-dependent methyltransferase [Proteobacteria bacterium]|nr:class I SAM-dependent methyltransferase [Pseudomonadota bacterium]
MSFLDRLRDLRANAQIRRWVREGMPLPPVPAAKRRIILGLLAKHGLKTFVETGTFKGDTLACVAARDIRAISVELSHEYFNRANQRFNGRPNVELHQGDSGEVLPRIVATLNEPALFWLDGHYSAGGTAHGELASPISAEMQSILHSPIKNHVILIDDAHEFTGEGGYPELGRFLSSIAADGQYRTSIHANIVVLEPR